MKRKVLVSLALTFVAMAIAGIWGCSSSDGTEDVPVEVKTPAVSSQGDSPSVSIFPVGNVVIESGITRVNLANNVTIVSDFEVKKGAEFIIE